MTDAIPEQPDGGTPSLGSRLQDRYNSAGDRHAASTSFAPAHGASIPTTQPPGYSRPQAHDALWYSIYGIIPVIGFIFAVVGIAKGTRERRKAVEEGRPAGVAIAAVNIGWFIVLAYLCAAVVGFLWWLAVSSREVVGA